MKPTLLASILVATFALAGCATPTVPPLLDDDTAVFAKDADSQIAADEQWWRAANDPTLNALVEKALANNRSLKAVAARMDAVRAIEAAAPFAIGPSSGLSGSLSHTTTRTGDIRTTSRSEGQAFSVQWELPLFGKGQAQLASAQAQLRQAQWQGEASRVSLTASVVRSYAQLKANVDKVDAAQKSLAALKEIAEIRQNAVNAGLAPASDAENSRAQVLAMESQIASLQAVRVQLKNTLAVLCGTTKLKMLDDVTADFSAVPALQKVDPSLLRKRPDVLAAEESVAIAAAQAGIDRASLWPQLSLGTSVSLTPGDGAPRTLSSVGSVGLSIPLLNWFTLKAQADSSVQKMKASVDDYRQTVLTAWEEAQAAYADGLAAEKRAKNASEQLATLTTQAERAALLEKEGISSRIDRLNAEVSRNSQDGTTADEKSQLMQAWARLQKASFAKLTVASK